MSSFLRRKAVDLVRSRGHLLRSRGHLTQSAQKSVQNAGSFEAIDPNPVRRDCDNVRRVSGEFDLRRPDGCWRASAPRLTPCGRSVANRRRPTIATTETTRPGARRNSMPLTVPLLEADMGCPPDGNAQHEGARKAWTDAKSLRSPWSRGDSDHPPDVGADNLTVTIQNPSTVRIPSVRSAVA